MMFIVMSVVTCFYVSVLQWASLLVLKPHVTNCVCAPRVCLSDQAQDVCLADVWIQKMCSSLCSTMAAVQGRLKNRVHGCGIEHKKATRLDTTLKLPMTDVEDEQLRLAEGRLTGSFSKGADRPGLWGYLQRPRDRGERADAKIIGDFSRRMYEWCCL
jgi:hypothetical protein